MDLLQKVFLLFYKNPQSAHWPFPKTHAISKIKGIWKQGQFYLLGIFISFPMQLDSLPLDLYFSRYAHFKFSGTCCQNDSHVQTICPTQDPQKGYGS